MSYLETIDIETLLCSPLGKVKYIVEDILPTGLHLFCGASKIGKSWLMLKLCLQVSRGEELWGLKTEKSDVLYLCLEDTLLRIQSRLFKITDCGSENFRVAVASDKISNGLVGQLEKYIFLHPNTKLIVIDTFQKIRNLSKENTYVSDYGDISVLKEFADKNNLAIVVVHHIRKQGDSDVFNKVSGTTGIMGSADTTFILEKKARNSNNAILYVTGRDVEYQELELKFQNCNWELVNRQTMEEVRQSKVPEVIYKIIDYMKDKNEWKGSSTELLNELQENCVSNNVITKLLNEYHSDILYENGITFDTSRSKNGRLIELKRKMVTADDGGDSNDSCFFRDVLKKLS